MLKPKERGDTLSLKSKRCGSVFLYAFADATPQIGRL